MMNWDLCAEAIENQNRGSLNMCLMTQFVTVGRWEYVAILEGSCSFIESMFESLKTKNLWVWYWLAAFQDSRNSVHIQPNRAIGPGCPMLSL